MTVAERPDIPYWAQGERLVDVAWLADNLQVLWPAARNGYKAQGRGAVVIDTTATPDGDGHPIYYMPAATFERLEHADALRMIHRYDPAAELVVMILKTGDRDSTYRVQLPNAPSNGT